MIRVILILFIMPYKAYSKDIPYQTIKVSECNFQIAIRNNKLRYLSEKIRKLNNHIDLLLYQEKERRFKVKIRPNELDGL